MIALSARFLASLPLSIVARIKVWKGLKLRNMSTSVSQRKKKLLLPKQRNSRPNNNQKVITRIFHSDCQRSLDHQAGKVNVASQLLGRYSVTSHGLRDPPGCFLSHPRTEGLSDLPIALHQVLLTSIPGHCSNKQQGLVVFRIHMLSIIRQLLGIKL